MTPLTLPKEVFRTELLRTAAVILGGDLQSTNQTAIEVALSLMSACGISEMEETSQCSECDNLDVACACAKSSPSSDKQETLKADHYRAFVGYTAFPSMAELEKEFGKNRVSNLFDGREWKKHASCVGMNETPGEKEFWAAPPPAELLDDSEKIIAWGDKQGYRPATHQEAIDFAKAHPELQKQFWIVALGSFALFGDNRYVAVLHAFSGGRALDGARWFGSRWLAGFRFLFVKLDKQERCQFVCGEEGTGTTRWFCEQTIPCSRHPLHP